MRFFAQRATALGLAATIALAFVLYVGGSDPTGATFTPTGTARFCNGLGADFPQSLPVTDSDLAGDPSCIDDPIPANTAGVDLTTSFTLPSGDSIFSSPIVVNLPGTVAGDAAIPDGEKVGGLRSDITLSLLNGPCATSLVAEFVLHDATTTGATINPLAEGTTNRFSNLVTDGNGDGIADADSPGVTSNLGIYEELFTPDLGVMITPKSRYTGMTKVPTNGDWQIVSVFIFDAGGLDGFAFDADDEPNVFGRVSHAPADGTLMIPILNDPTATQASVSPIHDLCTPIFAQTMLLGTTPGGHTRYTTPAAGTIGVSAFAYGQRDADGDGLSNTTDTCALIADTGTDTDFDGIDNACDPTPGADTGFGDHDGDVFANRQDNCPTVANGGAAQSNSETNEAYINTAPDGGPKTDAIGDACDPNPLTADTEGTFEQAYFFVPKCIGGGDADGDDYCTAQDLDDGDSGVLGWSLNKGLDQEYPARGGGHGDGFGGNVEIYVGTDPLLCDDPPYPPGPSPWWPPDLVGSGSINISDVLALKPIFGDSFPPPRWDIAPSGSINISDVLALKPVFGASC